VTAPFQCARWAEGDTAVQARLAEALESNSVVWEPVQEGRDRHVFRAELEESGGHVLPVILKVRQQRRGIRRVRDAFGDLLGRGPTNREWRALTQANDHGLPGPQPLAWASGSEGTTALFMRECGERALLDEFERVGTSEAESLTRALADLVHALHHTGFVHGDLHLGNLRVSDSSAERSLSFVDLQKFRATQSERARLADWARLAFSLERATGNPALAELLCHRSGLGNALSAARIAFLADHQRGRARRRLTTGDARLSQLAELEIVDATTGAPGQLVGLRDHDVPAALIEAAMGPGKPEVVGRPRREGRVEIHRVVVGGRPLIRKHTRNPGLRRALADLFRGSPAARAFRRGQRDRLISDRSAPALAFLERRRLGLPLESWLFMDEVGEHDLDQYRPRTPQEAESIAREVARWLAAQHLQGLGHRDAKGGNLRLTIDAPTASAPSPKPQLWFVDLEDLTGPASISISTRQKALVQLNASLSDELYPNEARKRALVDYAEALPFEASIEEVIKTIARESRARGHRWRGVPHDEQSEA